ncbi:hypothetical protein CDL15_Pgr022266 [Punica granatum]|uniref:Uncharacterized protein n=1 Tax=Punica granatum TaxID=22663 RepID=A0A218WMH8_PUNGR|nr:hypothetical protein CDL15_Pgr022266 [Punica granatum]
MSFWRWKKESIKFAEMASRVEIDGDSDTNNRGSMWVLDQKLDQPMDEEAGKDKSYFYERFVKERRGHGCDESFERSS